MSPKKKRNTKRRGSSRRGPKRRAPSSERTRAGSDPAPNASPPRRRRPRRRPPRWLGWALLVIVVGAGAWGMWLLRWATRSPEGERAPIAIEWPVTAEALSRLGVIDDPGAFRALLWVASPFITVEAGPHLLQTGLSPAEVLRRLGRLSSRQREKVVVPEGYNRFEIADRLEQLGVVGRERFLGATVDREALLVLGVGGDSAEGFLFPATYELATNTAAARVMEKLVEQAHRRHARLFSEHASALASLEELLDWGPEDVITLASVIEEEASQVEEMPIVASVFFNRLSDPLFRPLRMLQSDPTAGYGCRVLPDLPSCVAFDGKHVTPEMLRDAHNPYNTYRREGLPPGPITNPGEKAIEAVLQPADTDYLFFVAKGDGRHTFSRTYEEHDAAVQARRDQLQKAEQTAQ